jgi:PBSX family phage portal protein
MVDTPDTATPVTKFQIIEGGSKVIKDLGPQGVQPKGGAIQPNAFETEDEYQQLYVGATRDQGIIQPPYNLRQLDRLSLDSNSLHPCIEAMVTNVDGTGYEFKADDEDPEDAHDDSRIYALKEFFDQPWPTMSFGTMRKNYRRQLERTGNGFFEVLRNAADEIVMLRLVDAKMMRLLRLDDAISVPTTVIRGGAKVTINVMTRERRYCQLVNGVSLMYFKEFGSKRDLHKKTAVWAQPGQRLPANMRATEIIHFTLIPDSHTPYGLPRWINQVPSVLGSRKAEEFNLDFFDNGGVPPVMIMLQGGVLGSQTRKAIEQMTSGEAKKNNRLRVIEVEPSGGGLNQPAPQARVTVERFGGDRTTDSMFEKYDERCEERVRRSFRLPPIFVGQSKDYNFATAFASYTVTEAQVFKPEREEFDEVFNMKVLPEMGYEGYIMRSLPLVIQDATLQLQGLEVIQTMADQVEPADIVKEVNKITGLTLKIADAAPDLKTKLAQAAAPPPAPPPGATHTMDAQGNIQAIQPAPTGPPGLTSPGGPSPTGGTPGKITPKAPPKTQAGTTSPAGIGRAVKADTLNGRELAMKASTALRKRDMLSLAEVMGVVNSFDAAGREQFNQFAGELAFLDNSFDPQGLAELSTCTMAVMMGMTPEHNHSH